MRVYAHPTLPDQVILDVGLNRRAQQYLLAKLRDAAQYDPHHRGFVMRRETWKALRGTTEHAGSLVSFAEQFDVPIVGAAPVVPTRSVCTQTCGEPRRSCPLVEQGTQTSPLPAEAPIVRESTPPPSRLEEEEEGEKGEEDEGDRASASSMDSRPLDSRLLTHPLSVAVTSKAPQVRAPPSITTQSVLSGVSDFRFIHRSRVHKQSILQGVS